MIILRYHSNAAVQNGCTSFILRCHLFFFNSHACSFDRKTHTMLLWHAASCSKVHLELQFAPCKFSGEISWWLIAAGIACAAVALKKVRKQCHVVVIMIFIDNWSSGSLPFKIEMISLRPVCLFCHLAHQYVCNWASRISSSSDNKD